jgi:hypothetical protein
MPGKALRGDELASFSFPTINTKNLVIYGSVLAVALLGIENYCRRNHPNTMIRPSNTINEVSIYVGRFTTWIGYQIARLTDIWQFIKEIIGQDLYNIFHAGGELFVSCFKFIKGYHDYCAESVTPLTYNIISTSFVGIVIACLIGTILNRYDITITSFTLKSITQYFH